MQKRGGLTYSTQLTKAGWPAPPCLRLHRGGLRRGLFANARYEGVLMVPLPVIYCIDFSLPLSPPHCGMSSGSSGRTPKAPFELTSRRLPLPLRIANFQSGNAVGGGGIATAAHEVGAAPGEGVVWGSEHGCI